MKEHRRYFTYSVLEQLEEKIMSKVHRLLTWVSLLVIASMLVAACGAPQVTPVTTVAEPPAAQPTEPPAAEQPTEAPIATEAPTEPPAPAEKKVVTLIWTQEFDTLNPIYTNMWFVTALFPVYVCQAWWFDDQNNAFPNLVTEIPSLENG